MWYRHRKAHSSAGQTLLVISVQQRCPWSKGEGTHAGTGPLLLPLQDPAKMGPGLDQFLPLQWKRGGGEPGAGLASCSSSHPPSIVTSLQD